MFQELDPTKLDLLIPTKEDLQGLRKVRVMDIMEGFTKNFHPEGLFSVEIFGKPGEERRNLTFAYIDLNVPILHPLIFKTLVDLKALYGDIMAGRAYAIFDETTKDFIKSNVAEGETGYAFFVKHLSKLQFEKRPSISRKLYIEFVEKFRSNPYISQLVLLPAGVRDYSVDETGKPSEDEVNGMYRSIMAVAANLENINFKESPEFADSARMSLQVKVLELYRYIVGLLFGKHKMIQGSFMSRKVSNTTRNVISSHIPRVKSYGDDSSISPNTTVMGLYQYMRDIIPLMVFHIRNKFASSVFTGPNSPMRVVDPKTLRSKMVPVNSKEYSRWTTMEGIEKVADNYSQEDMRHYPVMVGDYYFGLLYKGPDMTFKFFQGMEDFPENLDPKYVAPITMTELLYMACYEEALDSYGWTTRYPVTVYGSTYPGDIRLKTTVVSEVRVELDEMWQATNRKATNFPINGQKHFNSMSPAVSHIPRAGADYDGDQMSHYCVMTEEAKKEVKEMLGSKDYYLTIDGKMAFSQNNDYVALALKYMTRR